MFLNYVYCAQEPDVVHVLKCFMCIYTYVVEARSDVAVQTDHHDRREHDEIPAINLEQHLSM